MEECPESYSFLEAIHANGQVAVAVLSDIHSDHPVIEYMNRGFSVLTGYTQEESYFLLKGGYYDLVHENWVQGLKDLYLEEFCPNTGYQYDYEIIRKDGTACWVSDHGFFYRDSSGRDCVQVVLTDISGFKTQQQELSDLARRLKIGLKVSGNCVFEVDLQRRLYTFLENSEDIFDVPGEEILKQVRPFQVLEPLEFQKALTDFFVHPDDADVVSSAFKQIFDGKSVEYEARMKAGNTQYIWCNITVTPVMENEVPVRMVGVITNIEEIKRRTERLKKEATLDLFSGLYNKKNVELLIRNSLETLPDQQHALLLMDLDNFKHINDTYGHNVGDSIIREVSESLKTGFRKGDIIGRFGGDEFLVFMKRIPGKKAVLTRLKALLHSKEEPVVTKSIGVAFYPEDGRDYDELLKNADLALYRSKQGKNMYTLAEDICRTKS